MVWLIHCFIISPRDTIKEKNYDCCQPKSDVQVAKTTLAFYATLINLNGLLLWPNRFRYVFTMFYRDLVESKIELLTLIAKLSNLKSVFVDDRQTISA